MAIKILSITTLNPGRVVQIEAPSHEDLVQYKHEVGDITIVVASQSCSSEDLKAIRAYCHELDYFYEGPLSIEVPSVSVKENMESTSGHKGTTKK